MTLSQYHHSQPQLLLENVEGDREIFLQLANIFMRDSSEMLALLLQAASAGDLTQLAYQSHALKGMVGQLGAQALVDMLFAIEEECKRGACICDHARLSAISLEFEQVRQELIMFIAQF